MHATRRHRQLPPLRRPAALRARRRRARRRRHRRRGAGRADRAGAGGEGARRRARGAGRRRGHDPGAGAPALGLVPDHGPRRPLPGEAASWSRRARSCRCRSTTTAPSTGSWCAAPPRSPATTRCCWCARTSRSTCRSAASHRLANPGQDPGRDRRGADRRLPRGGRHRPHRGRLRPPVSRASVSVKFGTSGLRGLVAEMTDPVCEAHVRRFLAPPARDRGRPARGAGRPRPAAELAPDRRRLPPRRSAPRARPPSTAACVPTPALALEAARRGAPAIMVTGSHIPFDRNGLKFYRPDGEITKADEAGILAALAAPRPAPRRGAVRVDAGRRARATSRARCDFFGPGLPRRPAHRRSTSTAPPAAITCGAAPRRARRRGRAARPHRRLRADRHRGDRRRRRPRASAAGSREHRLAALVSTDGDGDRPLIADETGAVLRGDAARRAGGAGSSAPTRWRPR